MRITMVNLVRGFIQAKDILADNDVRLAWAIWDYQLKHMKPAKNIMKMSAKDVMNMWAEGEISSFENISRSRRKCQEKYPETRGKIYQLRHKQQEQVKQDLRNA